MTMSSQNEQIPTTLYKYRHWGNAYHRRMLSARELFFPSVPSLNDPFDAAFREPPANVQVGFGLIDRLSRSLPGADAGAIHLLGQAISAASDPELDADALAVLLINNATGLASFSEMPLEPVMWSHYADRHQGFCVGIDTARLLMFLQTLNRRIELHAVSYREDRPDLHRYDPPAKELLLLHLTHKSMGWSYEREFRLIMFDTPDVPVILPPGIISEVILGYRMPEAQRREIIALVRDWPGLKVYQIGRNRQFFQLQKAEVQLDGSRGGFAN
jgi:hypothetical protein